jgi:hypothetical protein
MILKMSAAETVQQALLEGLIVEANQSLAVPWNRPYGDRPDIRIVGEKVKSVSARGKAFLRQCHAA